MSERFLFIKKSRFRSWNVYEHPDKLLPVWIASFKCDADAWSFMAAVMPTMPAIAKRQDLIRSKMARDLANWEI